MRKSVELFCRSLFSSAKPFDQSVLMAKINALLRRTYDFGASSSIIEHRGAILNTGDGSLSYEGEKIELTKNEMRILQTLMENKLEYSRLNKQVKDLEIKKTLLMKKR